MSSVGMMSNSRPRFYRLKQYMIDTYGAPLHRVPIDPGFGCPHREADGRGGCTFCPPDGSRAAQARAAGTLEEQVAEGIRFARHRYKATRFMAYIQAFTGTFAPASEQRRLYERVLAAFPFDAVSIGTRPDCLPEATLSFLDELKRKLDVWVELGIQTTHDQTLRRVNRGHGWRAGREAILALHDRGIRVGVHAILGLPGETHRHFRTTAMRLSRLPIDGVKLHNLHVVRGTRLADEYAAQPFPVFDEYEYTDIAIDFLRRVPAGFAIMRLNTDTAAAELVAPRWGMAKGQFLLHLEAEMARRDVRQGDLVTRRGTRRG